MRMYGPRARTPRRRRKRKSSAKAKSAGPCSSNASSASGASSTRGAKIIESQVHFDAMAAAVKLKGRQLVRVGGAVYQFIISDCGERGNFTLDLKHGSGKAKAGLDPNADCVITMADADFSAVCDGKLDAVHAFMTGKLKITGQLMLARKIHDIIEAAK